VTATVAALQCGVKPGVHCSTAMDVMWTDVKGKRKERDRKKGKRKKRKRRKIEKNIYFLEIVAIYIDYNIIG
jgi:hypothetical protein